MIRNIPAYRKTLILACKELTYLDDRPVFPRDRACAEAWKRGGVLEENNERDRWIARDRQRIQDSVNHLLQLRDNRALARAESTEDSGIGMPVNSDTDNETTIKTSVPIDSTSENSSADEQEELENDNLDDNFIIREEGAEEEAPQANSIKLPWKIDVEKFQSNQLPKTLIEEIPDENLEKNPNTNEGWWNVKIESDDEPGLKLFDTPVQFEIVDKKLELEKREIEEDLTGSIADCEKEEMGELNMTYTVDLENGELSTEGADVEKGEIDQLERDQQGFDKSKSFQTLRSDIDSLVIRGEMNNAFYLTISIISQFNLVPLTT